MICTIMLVLASAIGVPTASLPNTNRGRTTVDPDSLVRAVSIGSLQIALSKSETLSSVQLVLGATPIVDEHTISDPLRECYQIDGRPTFVELQSDPEMGGPEHRVQGVLMYRYRPKGMTCPRVKGFPVKVATNNGLSIGSRVADVVARMGTPKRRPADSLVFEYDRFVQDPAEFHDFDRPYDVLGSLAIRTRRGTVIGLRVWYDEIS